MHGSRGPAQGLRRRSPTDHWLAAPALPLRWRSGLGRCGCRAACARAAAPHHLRGTPPRMHPSHGLRLALGMPPGAHWACPPLAPCRRRRRAACMWVGCRGMQGLRGPARPWPRPWWRRLAAPAPPSRLAAGAAGAATLAGWRPCVLAARACALRRACVWVMCRWA